MITLRMHRGGNYNDSISSKFNSNFKMEKNIKKTHQQTKNSLASASSKGKSTTSLDRLASVFCNMRNNDKNDENITSSGIKTTDLNSSNDNINKSNECEDEKKQNNFERSQTIAASKQVNNAWSISRKVSKLAKEKKAAKTLGNIKRFFFFFTFLMDTLIVCL